ncbi:MAG: TldD/PmbA family protein [Methanospirillum sp.]|uniref:TldD/PmbA family protein n=1 Tax=Methanospirillum sp. TaxID=45200 RepID=UPI00236D7802|nr:metallopeptidase TldD-related protein [Methanospirillum sp.]MDD1729911.1 TldD/PmbA family protein [Methanospirillum sp.]
MSVEQILKAAESRVDEIEVCVGHGDAISAELKRKQIEIGTRSEGSGLVIRIIKDGRIGISSTDNQESWKKCLDAAISSAKFSDAVDWKGLPKPVDLPKESLAFDADIKADPALAKDLIDRMLQGSETWPAEVTGGGVSLSCSSHLIANSSGLWYEARDTHVSLSLEMIADQSTGFEYDSTWNLKAVKPEFVGEQAAFYAAKGKDGKEIETGTYDIILAPTALSSLLDATFVPALSGRNVHTGRSYFAGKMGEEVMDPRFSLIDDPFDHRGIGNCYWDGEGTPVQKTAFIDKGVLTSFAYDLKTAYRYGMQPTGHGVRTGMNGAPGIGNHNLILNGPVMDVMTDDAIYIHDIVGAHTANPMSGDFSVELAGPFRVKNGTLDTPIKTGMLSGNVFEMLKHIEGCSADTRTLGSLILPATRFSGVTIVGRV